MPCPSQHIFRGSPVARKVIMTLNAECHHISSCQLLLCVPALQSNMVLSLSYFRAPESLMPVLLPGIPQYRNRVQYVPQRPSLLPGSPREFLQTISTFNSRSGKHSAKESNSHSTEASRPFDIAKQWGLDDAVWDRAWANLSGGESQRVLLAIAVGLGTAEVLLLDGGHHYLPVV